MAKSEIFRPARKLMRLRMGERDFVTLINFENGRRTLSAARRAAQRHLCAVGIYYQAYAR